MPPKKKEQTEEICTMINKEHFNFKDRTGEKFMTNQNLIVEIIKYDSYHKCTIKFEDNTVVENISLNNLRKGKIVKPINRVGEKYITNEGFKVEILEYNGCYNCKILFNEKEIRENVHYSHIKNGKVKNYNFPQIYGIGYIGVGRYNTYSKVGEIYLYNRWSHTIKRCYDYKTLQRKPSYKGVTVCEEWHNFQNFAAWFEENYNPEIMQGWELDKDILIKGNKIYSPETCCFVPKEINTLFTKGNSRRGEYPIGVSKKGNKFQAVIINNYLITSTCTHKTPEEAFRVYKTSKESHIKEVANKWRGKISEEVYHALHNYQVEITD